MLQVAGENDEAWFGHVMSVENVEYNFTSMMQIQTTGDCQGKV